MASLNETTHRPETKMAPYDEQKRHWALENKMLWSILGVLASIGALLIQTRS